MTLEDPVEYVMPHLRQASVDASRKLDFASGLRGLLRQDPDVLLLGEIRDQESCAMALRAAMSGHQVLTTLHSSSTLGALARLLELGAERSLLASCLSGIVSQRLLRRCCFACQASGEDTPDADCLFCSGSGYYGRVPVMEVLPATASLMSLRDNHGYRNFPGPRIRFSHGGENMTVQTLFAVSSSASRGSLFQPRYDCLAQAMAFFQLRQMLQAGVHIDAALIELEQLEPLRVQKYLWRDIRERLAQGDSLSDAFAHWNRVFDQSVIASLQAGEASGQLELTLDRLDEQLRWQHSVAVRLKTVLSYPLLASASITLVCLFLLGSVVPAMAGFLSNAGVQEPWHTQLLLYIAGFVERSYVAIALCAVTLMALAVVLPALDRSARFLRDTCVLEISGVGGLIATLSCARYCRTLAMLNQNGVDLVTAMQISEGVVSNEAVRLDLSQLRLGVVAGKTLSELVQKCRYMPSTTKRMISIGESAAALSHSLNQSGEHLQLTAAYRIDRIERLIGPVVLMCCGALYCRSTMLPCRRGCCDDPLYTL